MRPAHCLRMPEFRFRAMLLTPASPECLRWNVAMTVPVISSLSPLWETWIEFLASGHGWHLSHKPVSRGSLSLKQPYLEKSNLQEFLKDKLELSRCKGFVTMFFFPELEVLKVYFSFLR